MMLGDLREFQHLMFRTYVRHVMLFATFPYHVAQHMRRTATLDAASERRSHRAHHRFEDRRWLR
jgi:hypothetical protein